MSSLRRQKRRQCKNKIAYVDQTHAVGALIAMHEAKIWSGQQTYKCPFSNHWHVGRRKSK